MFDSQALTKIQSIILVAIIAVAAVVVYTIFNKEQTSEAIKIGVLTDLDGQYKEVYQSVILAAEQINAEGGLLGRHIEVIGEDNDGGFDPVLTTNALTKLITSDNVDFIIGTADLTVQEIIAQHKKVFISVLGVPEMCEQRVLDDYDKYKYYFTVGFNESSTFQGITNSLEGLRQKTGFNKICYIGEDLGLIQGIMTGLDSYLPQNGFELVYKGKFPLETVDFSSYFAQAEAAGAEVMITLIATDLGVPFVKEYSDRQSPIFLFGGFLISTSFPESYDWTDGKCEDTYTATSPTCAGFAFTDKTLSTREAFIDRWGETPYVANGYDALRFILADAIERAGTIETDAIVEALEETSVETANARNFVFTSSHGVMMGTDPNDPEADYMISLGFEWQNGELVPVDPIKIMEEAGAYYTFPDWSGPWDDLD